MPRRSRRKQAQRVSRKSRKRSTRTRSRRYPKFKGFRAALQQTEAVQDALNEILEKNESNLRVIQVSNGRETGFRGWIYDITVEDIEGPSGVKTFSIQLDGLGWLSNPQIATVIEEKFAAA